jgi:hypothetical protein
MRNMNKNPRPLEYVAQERAEAMENSPGRAHMIVKYEHRKR